MSKKVKMGEHDVRYQDAYISLTDIAKQSSDNEPFLTITAWMRNSNTLLFLEEWERQNNPDFKPSQMTRFKMAAMDNRSTVTVKRYVEETGATGLRSKQGRGGGTFAHAEIALFFCYWLSPPFAVWMLRTFQHLLGAEAERQNLQFHIRRITDNIDEARNWLDTIPFQEKDRDRRKKLD